MEELKQDTTYSSEELKQMETNVRQIKCKRIFYLCFFVFMVFAIYCYSQIFHVFLSMQQGESLFSGVLFLMDVLSALMSTYAVYSIFLRLKDYIRFDDLGFRYSLHEGIMNIHIIGNYKWDEINDIYLEDVSAESYIDITTPIIIHHYIINAFTCDGVKRLKINIFSHGCKSADYLYNGVRDVKIIKNERNLDPEFGNYLIYLYYLILTSMLFVHPIYNLDRANKINQYQNVKADSVKIKEEVIKKEIIYKVLNSDTVYDVDYAEIEDLSE